MTKENKTFNIIATHMSDLNMLASTITGCLDKEPNKAHINVEVKDQQHKDEIESFLEDFFSYEDTGATYEITLS